MMNQMGMMMQQQGVGVPGGPGGVGGVGMPGPGGVGVAPGMMQSPQMQQAQQQQVQQQQVQQQQVCGYLIAMRINGYEANFKRAKVKE